MLNNKHFKNILQALILAVSGLLLLTLTFLFNFLVFQIITFFIPNDIKSIPEVATCDSAHHISY